LGRGGAVRREGDKLSVGFQGEATESSFTSHFFFSPSSIKPKVRRTWPYRSGEPMLIGGRSLRWCIGFDRSPNLSS